MKITLTLNLNSKQADDVAAEMIAWLINYPVEVLDYEVER